MTNNSIQPQRERQPSRQQAHKQPSQVGQSSKMNPKQFSSLQKWLLVLGVIGIVMSLVSISGQEASLATQRADLLQEIERYKDDITEEQQTSQRFVNEKTRLIEQKQEEIVRVNNEIRMREAEILKLRREASQLDAGIASIEQREAMILSRLRARAETLAAEVAAGIPFDREGRQSALTSIILDTQTQGITVSEILNRLDAFLKSEQGMAYDSQVLRAVVNVQGAARTVDLLRIGRIFFAIDSGEGVFKYVHDADGGYRLEDANPVSFVEEKNIRDAIAMIQGKLPPDIIPIALPPVPILSRSELQTQ